MGEMNELKVFTSEEANRLLPELTELITNLQENQRQVLAKEVEIDALEVLYPPQGKDEHSEEVTGEVEKYNDLVDRFYALIDEIQETGCFLKDIDTGLIDFYSLHQGRVVYLCWRMGEAEVGFWHEVGRGYTYRQPIVRDEKESSG